MKKILIIQTAFIGDVVLITPLIEALSKKFSCDTQLYLITTLKGKEILYGDPYLSDILCYDKRGREKGVFHFLRIVENLRKIHFDIAVIPHPSLRSSLLAYLAGIPCRVGFENRPGSVFFTHKAKYPLELHEVERNLQLAYLLGAPQGYYPLRVYISNKDKEFTREFIARNGILPEEIIIAINPCSVWDTKRWLPEGFAQVGDILTNELGAKIILVGGVEDGWLVEKVSLLMKTKPVLAVGRLTLKQLAGLMEYCKLFITNDSGPLHIAMAMKTPTVAIFGPTTPDLGFGPYGERYEIVEVKNLECRPCGKHGARRCPIKTFECMKQITPQQVVSAAKRLLMS